MNRTLARGEARGYLGAVADRIEIRVAARPLERLRIASERVEQRVDRSVEVAGERAVAGQVVDHGAVLRKALQRLVDQRERAGMVAPGGERRRSEVVLPWRHAVRGAGLPA